MIETDGCLENDPRVDRLVEAASRELDAVIDNVKNQPPELQKLFVAVIVTRLACDLLGVDFPNFQPIENKDNKLTNFLEILPPFSVE